MVLTTTPTWHCMTHQTMTTPRIGWNNLKEMSTKQSPMRKHLWRIGVARGLIRHAPHGAEDPPNITALTAMKSVSTRGLDAGLKIPCDMWNAELTVIQKDHVASWILSNPKYSAKSYS